MADRHDRRRLIIASDQARALLMVALAAVAAAGLPIVLVPLLAALASAAGTVEPPCVAACTASFVPDADLQRANALRVSVGQGAVVVGPALGSLLLMASSPSMAILLNAVTFLASAAAISAIPPGPAFRPTREGDAKAPSLLADVRAGARALRGAPTAVKLVAADVMCSGVYGLLTVTLVLVSHRLGSGADGYGLLLASFGVGGVVGATVVGRADGRSRWRATLTVALLLVGLTLAALGLAPTFAAAVALALFCGGGMVVGEVLSETALPRMLDDDVLGRAYGLVLPASLAGIVAGSLIAGPLVSLLGLQGALAMAGLSVLIVAGLLLRRPMVASDARALPLVHSA